MMAFVHKPYDQIQHLFYYLLIVVLLISCDLTKEQIISVDQETSVVLAVYLVDTQDESSTALAKEVDKVFDYTKIPFEQKDIRRFNEQPGIDSTIRVIYLNNTNPLDSIAKISLLKFVSNGGHIILTSLNEDRSADFLTGIRYDANYEFELAGQGIKFVKDALPGLSGKVIKPNQQMVSLKASNFTDDIEVIATTTNFEDLPVIYARQLGNGRVTHFNTYMNFGKQDRGLFLSLALPALQGVPYPVVNVAAISIDDFPKPIYSIVAEPISSEFRMNSAEFIRDVWWPDMLEISQQYGIPYTVYPCFNYNLVKTQPFEFKEWDAHTSTINGRQVLTSSWFMEDSRQNEFELGFHGYNHEELTEALWPNTEEIKESLEATRKKWVVEAFGDFPTSYVPPSNYIDSVGLVALSKAMPEVQYMASILSGDRGLGGDREFDYDPFVSDLFNIPRVSSGYIKTDDIHYNYESLFLYTGIWTHFIHLDDVYQIPREDMTTAGRFDLRNAEGLNWRTSVDNKPSMLAEWQNFLIDVKNTHPSIRFEKVSNAGKLTKTWRQSQANYQAAGDMYAARLVQSPQGPDQSYFWNLYVDKVNELKLESILRGKNLVFAKTPILDGSLYSVETNVSMIEFDEYEELMSEPQFFEPEVYDMVMEGYLNFEDQKASISSAEVVNIEEMSEEVLKTFMDSIAYYVANEDLLTATSLLKGKLETLETVDLELFEMYVRYLGFDERPNEIWDFLDHTYEQKSHSLAYQYLNWYLKDNAYPSPDLNELWLQRQLFDDPSNQTLFEEYLSYFYHPDYLVPLKQIIFNYDQAVGTGASYAIYVKYLIDFEPELLTTELQELNPKDQPSLWPYADLIAYQYAGAGNLQKALDWAVYADAINIQDKLQWLIELNQLETLETLYLEHIDQYPNDEQTKAFISEFWYSIGEYERSALVAKQFQYDTTLLKTREVFDQDIVYFKSDIQKFIILRAPEVLSANALANVQQSLRLKIQDYVSYQGDFVLDNFNQSVWNHSFSYHRRTESLYEHTLSVTYSDISDLQLSQPDVNNVPHTLSGLKYELQTPIRDEKYNFYGVLGMEMEGENTYFTAGGRVSKGDSIQYFSIGYVFSPNRTGPSISQNIYLGELMGYYERGARRKWQTIISPTLRHYTYEGIYQAALNARLNYNFKPLAPSRISPYAEGFISTANANFTEGNPFWIVSDRYFLGGGVSWTKGAPQIGTLFLNADAGAFYDSYTGPFLRVRGAFSFPIKKQVYVNGDIQYFNQERYYSNSAHIGISYFFNQKRKYRYNNRSYDQLYK